MRRTSGVRRGALWTACAGLVLCGAAAPGVAADGATGWLADVQQGDPKFQSIGRLNFGPHGLLLVADPKAAAVVVLETGDLGPMKKLAAPVKDVATAVANALGAKPGTAKIVDLAVNRESGRIYLSVQVGGESALLTVGADGKLAAYPLSQSRYVRVELPKGGGTKAATITGLAFAKDRILATGLGGEEFTNSIFSIPIPVKHGGTAEVFSAETYHVAHGKWETKAPIQSFIPVQENGKTFVVGAFACTPIAKFPLDDLESGAKVKGTSVVELGSGNRPLDMFSYEKNGKTWIVTNTQRFHKNLFGPSPLWGVRVDAGFLAASATNEKAARRNVQTPAGPDGIEIVEGLFGAVEVDKLSDSEMVVLRDTGSGLDLVVVPLP